MWHAVVSVFSQLIQFSYQITDMMGLANYGLAIILITILIKVVLYPLNNSQMKSMRTMQELQPRLKAIQAQYKDEPEKMQAETMKLYKEEGFNPMSGCLPLLVQMPILMAFYSALLKFKYVVPAHAQFLWIPNLSHTDPYFLLPLLAAATTYLQQKISTADPNDMTQRSMMIMMPIFIGWMATKFAAGLALYWVMFNILSILQQLYVNRRHPIVKNVAAAVEGSVSVAAVNEEDDGGTRDKGGKTDAKPGKKGKKR